jgi:hypothetical protein
MAPANPLAVVSTTGKPVHLNSASPAPPERRRRTRSRVQWPLLLFRNEGDGTVETTTQDLSSSGFYCLSKKPFAVGEMLTCALRVPNDHASGRERRLECQVLVVRVDTPISGQYGIACRTQEYHFASADAS